MLNVEILRGEPASLDGYGDGYGYGDEFGRGSGRGRG